MTNRSGQHHINHAAVRELRAEIDAALPPLRAKALTAVRTEPVNTQHAEYLAAHNALIRNGWTLRAISRHLGVSHRYLIDLRRGHRPARTEGRDWVAALWGLLASTDPVLPSGTGW